MEFDLNVFEKELRFLVNIDSGSRVVSGVNRLADWFAERFEALGWPTEFIEPAPGQYGKSLFTWHGDRETLDLLILCHADTVYPDGTAVKRPFRVEGERYLGPGVADMKSGCLMTLHALEQLCGADRLRGNIGVLINGEHELSCPSMRPVIEALSRKAAVVVATEPARADGSCVRQRKGISRYTVRFEGQGAHSGVNPQDGACAVTEMAHWILALRDLNDPAKGINLNPGLASGGTSVNVVPSAAECHVDVRVIAYADAFEIDEKLQQMARAPRNPDVKIHLEGGITRPPMTRHPRADELVEALDRIAAGLGLELTWSFSGGGSDASYATAFGIPALCGLGPVGGAYHTEKEYLERKGLGERLILFREFVEALGKGTI